MTDIHPEPVARFGRTNFRNQRKVFGIRQSDRRCHMYILGQTGTGKSTLLETILRQDFGTTNGAMLIDPHGDLAERLAGAIPESRRSQLIYWNVADTKHVVGFNPLAAMPSSRRSLMASFVLEAFKKLWPDFWGPRLEHVFRHALLVLLDQPAATLADVLRLFVDAPFRREAALRCANEAVRHFWLKEYEWYPERMRAEAISPIQNKVGAFLANPVLQQIITQPRNSFDFRDLMDNGKILLVNLSRGRLGEDVTSLLGSLLVSALGVAALSRAEVPEEQRRDFFVFLDEFQNFASAALIGMLPELRKYHVGLVLAHQHIAQLEAPVRDAILGNAGTTICFRLGAADAELLLPNFAPEMKLNDLISLPNHHFYLRLMVDGRVSRPFSAEVIRNVPLMGPQLPLK